MLIPLNISGREDLCLLVIRLTDGRYLVAVNELVNGFGLDSIPSYQILEEDSEECSPVPMFVHELGTCVSEDPLLAIGQMLEKLRTANL